MTKSKIDKAIYEALDEVSRVHDAVEFLNSLPEDPPCGKIRIGVFASVNFIVSSLEGLKEMRRYLGKRVKRQDVLDIKDGRRAYYYKAGNVSVKIVIDFRLKGSSCRRVQVGEEVTPIYKIACD